MMEWISVKDRLPPEYVKVMCYLEDGDYTVGYLFDKEENEWNLQSDVGTVTHWMPLPEPPVEKTKEELEIEMWSLMS